LDPAGYFVIYPIAEKGIIHLEHYSYDNRLLRILEGASPRAIYLKIIEGGWVTELSHAAYLGKELIKAEISLQTGNAYLQDAA
jgi:tetrahydromethanopterin S-methyltransferase subunit A